MYFTIGVSTSSLHRESTDSLILYPLVECDCVFSICVECAVCLCRSAILNAEMENYTEAQRLALQLLKNCTPQHRMRCISYMHIQCTQV